MERAYIEEVERLIWEWIDGELPEPQSGNTVRISVGPDQITFDENIADFFHGQRWTGAIAVRFNDLLLVNKDMIVLFCEPLPDMNYRVRYLDRHSMVRIQAGIIACRSNGSKRAAMNVREALGELADEFPKPHPKNKLITKYRIRNALSYRGQKRAVTYEEDKDEIFGVKYWDTLEDAVLERLANPKVANVLEL